MQDSATVYNSFENPSPAPVVALLDPSFKKRIHRAQFIAGYASRNRREFNRHARINPTNRPSAAELEWHNVDRYLQDYKSLNLSAGCGIALREVPVRT